MKKLLMFAAAFVMCAACSDAYDDTELSGRVEDLEGKMESVENDLDELKKKVDGLNETYRALTALFSGGVITNVAEVSNPATGQTGYRITIKTIIDSTKDPMVTESRDYTIWNGTAGAAGSDGDAGWTPQLGVELDPATGRYYWTVDGQPMRDNSGGYIYASAKDGAPGTPGLTGTPGTPGDDGLTPQLKIAQDESDGQTKWYVGYDKNGNGAIDDNEWEELGIFTGTVTGTSSGITITSDGNEVTIKQTGKPDIKFPIVSANTLGINFTEESLTTDGAHFYNGQVKEFTFTLENASENAIVKAEMQNDGDFTVRTSDDKVTVTAKSINTNGKVIVSVYDGANCYHTSFPVVADVPTATIDGDSGVVLLDASTTTTSTNITVTLDMPAKSNQQLTINSNMPAGWTLTPNTITVNSGQQSASVNVTVNGNAANSGKAYEITLSGEGIQTTGKLLAGILAKVSLTGSNYSSPYHPEPQSSQSYGEGSFDNLCDGSKEQHWGSAYWLNDLPQSNYGVYIDIELPNEYVALQFGYSPRGTSKNGNPTALAYGLSTNGSTYYMVGTAPRSGEGALPADNAEEYLSDGFILPDVVPFKYARFGITQSNMGDLTTNPKASGSISELSVYGLTL